MVKPCFIFFCLYFFFTTQARAQVADSILQADKMHKQFVSDSLLQISKRQENAIDQITRIKDGDAEIKAIDELLKSNLITWPHWQAWLYTERARATHSLYLNHGGDTNWDADDKLRLNMTQQVLADYQKAIDLDEFCQPYIRTQRLDFLKEVGKKGNSLYIQDLNYLKQHGYKQDWDGMGLSVNYTRGKTDQLGIGISAISNYQPFYRLRNVDPTDSIRRVVDSNTPTGISAFTLGYNQNLTFARTHEFTFSVLQVTAPLLIDITKLGFTSSPAYTSASWFYRPEIGFGWNWISLGYGYNFVFSKSDRKQSETHLFLIKLSYPIVKYNDDTSNADLHPH